MSCLIHIFRALVINYVIDRSPGFTIQCSKASLGFWRTLQQFDQCCLTYNVYSVWIMCTPFLTFGIAREQWYTSRRDTGFIFKQRFSESETCKLSANISQCAKNESKFVLLGNVYYHNSSKMKSRICAKNMAKVVPAWIKMTHIPTFLLVF